MPYESIVIPSLMLAFFVLLTTALINEQGPPDLTEICARPIPTLLESGIVSLLLIAVSAYLLDQPPFAVDLSLSARMTAMVLVSVVAMAVLYVANGGNPRTDPAFFSIFATIVVLVGLPIATGRWEWLMVTLFVAPWAGASVWRSVKPD